MYRFKMEKYIVRLYKWTELTMQGVADHTGVSLKNTRRILQTYLHPLELEDIKRKNYSRSKQGDKNPMLGKHPVNYKGECADGKGYLTIYKPSWYTGRKGSERVFKHSVVMCEQLGLTEIPSGFVVHHIDGDKTNNNPNNLALMTMAAHARLHSSERATTREKSRRVQEDSKRTAFIDVSGR